MENTKNIEDKIERAFRESIGKEYTLCVESEKIKREEYYRDIESQKDEIKGRCHKYLGREIISGVKNKSINIKSLNDTGSELIGKLHKTCEEFQCESEDKENRDFGRNALIGIIKKNIDIISLNTEGRKLINNLHEALDEFKEELENVEGEFTIEEDFDCDLHINNRSEYVEIVESLLYMLEVESEDERKEELREMYFKALYSEIENLDETQKKKAVKGGELLMNALLEEKNINKYDNNIDEIL